MVAMLSDEPSADPEARIPAGRTTPDDPAATGPPSDVPSPRSAAEPDAPPAREAPATTGATPTTATGSGDEHEPPRAGRRPRRIVRRTLKTAVALAVVLAFLALGDRWAVLYAENAAARQVQKALKLHAEPEVHIDSFPFIGQILAGNIDHVEVNVPHVDAGPVSVAQVKGAVDDLRIVGGLPSSVKGAVLSRVRGDILLDFKDLNREVGASQLRLTPGPARTPCWPAAPCPWAAPGPGSRDAHSWSAPGTAVCA